MSTKLNKVVQSMSQVSIPQDILNKVDMKSLLKDFSEDYKKLDDLKAVRARHEERNFVSRWWNNDELEDAQLDAAELQASFSKKLGQLMVISVAQSQQLHQQQVGLSDQQHIIKKQTEQLAENDEHLNHQQLSLEEQNKKLENLVNEYFKLKGLTQDGALKLIKIANEVKETKDSLMTSFGCRVQEIEGIRQNILTEQSELIDSQTQQLNAFKKEAKQSLDGHQQQIDEKMQEIEGIRQDILTEQSELIDSQTQQLSAFKKKVEQSIDEIEQHTEQRIKQALEKISQTDEQLQLSVNTVKQDIVNKLSQALEQQKQQQADYDLHWQADKAQVLEHLARHQERWIQEVQEQNSRFEEQQADNHQLQQQLKQQLQKQLSKQEQRHLEEVETLRSLLDSLKVESAQNNLNWKHRWKMMTRTVAGSFTVLTAILGYLVYIYYYQLPLF